MFQRIILLTIASSVSMLILGIFIGTAVANQLPVKKNPGSNNTATANSAEMNYEVQIKELEQEIIKQGNMRQNCERLLNKLSKQPL